MRNSNGDSAIGAGGVPLGKRSGSDLPGKNRGTVGQIGEVRLGFTKLYKLFEYSIKQILNDDYVDVDGLSSFIIRPRQLHTEEDHGIFWRLLFPLP